MTEKRQFEVLLVRLVPHALRDDFITVGVAVVESSAQAAADSHQLSALSRQAAASGDREARARFVDFRVTRDWKRIACFAPDFEIEVLEELERVVRGGIGEIAGAELRSAVPTSELPGDGVSSRERLLALLDRNFGTVFDVGPVKAMVARDPAAEMRVLERDYLEVMAETDRGRGRARYAGRIAIVGRMSDAFAAAGVLEMLARDLDMREFTGEHDPFRVDFGFRVGKTLKMFQALALNVSREPAVTLAYRYGRIQAGMRGRGEEAAMTAIISDEAARVQREAASGVAMLRANEISVRPVGEMRGIAEEAKLEIGA